MQHASSHMSLLTAWSPYLIVVVLLLLSRTIGWLKHFMTNAIDFGWVNILGIKGISSGLAGPLLAWLHFDISCGYRPLGASPDVEDLCTSGQVSASLDGWHWCDVDGDYDYGTSILEFRHQRHELTVNANLYRQNRVTTYGWCVGIRGTFLRGTRCFHHGKCNRFNLDFLANSAVSQPMPILPSPLF